MAGPANYSITIWEDDNAPQVIWRFPFDLTGSDFILSILMGSAMLHRQLSKSELSVDLATNSLSWAYSPSDFANIPALTGSYRLTRLMSGGEIRTYVVGSIARRSVFRG